MDKKLFWQRIEEACKIVESWPAWKQSCLGATYNREDQNEKESTNR
jgi:hypothetical protein